MGHSPAGIFGYSHMLGGYAGGQAEYARVPFADVGPLKIEDDLTDEQVLFLSDIFPTGYMGAEMCDIKPGRRGRRLGRRPGRAVRRRQRLPARRGAGHRHRPLRRTGCGWPRSTPAPRRSTTRSVDVAGRAAASMTAGRGPDACIDAVGHGGPPRQPGHARLRPGQAGDPAGDRAAARAAARRSWPAATAAPSRSSASYGGFDRQVPDGRDDEPVADHPDRAVPRAALPAAAAATASSAGEIDPSFVISHRMPLERRTGDVRDCSRTSRTTARRSC